jgi:cytochrome c oxidase subunit 4
MPEPEHGHTEAPPHHEIPYGMVFIALVVLTIVTVGVAMKRFEPEAINVLIALAIASVKASLVALYFMHLKFEGKLIYLIAIVPVCLCVLLICALLPDIVMTDPVKNADSSSLKVFNPIHLVGAKPHGEAGAGGGGH